MESQNQKPQRRRKSSNKGKKFEDVVKASFLKIPNVSVDRLRDTFQKKKNVDNPADFIVYKEPHEIYVECKSHKGNTFPFTCLRQEQLTGMIEKSKIEGVLAGIILWYIDHDITVWIPIDDVSKHIESGAKSINVKELDYLNCIYITGEKKRVYFDYDMNKFMEELYNE